jgi:hypothetical protein
MFTAGLFGCALRRAVAVCGSLGITIFGASTVVRKAFDCTRSGRGRKLSVSLTTDGRSTVKLVGPCAVPFPPGSVRLALWFVICPWARWPLREAASQCHEHWKTAKMDIRPCPRSADHAKLQVPGAEHTAASARGRIWKEAVPA